MAIMIMEHRGTVARYEARRGIAHLLLETGEMVELSITAIGGSNQYPKPGDVLEVAMKDGIAVFGTHARDFPLAPIPEQPKPVTLWDHLREA
jgi:hypothetical protein